MPRDNDMIICHFTLSLFLAHSLCTRMYNKNAFKHASARMRRRANAPRKDDDGPVIRHPRVALAMACSVKVSFQFYTKTARHTLA